jgi:hypothetical protein
MHVAAGAYPPSLDRLGVTGSVRLVGSRVYGFLRALAGLQPPLCSGLGECVDQVRPVIVARIEVVAALDEYGDAKRVE